MIILHQGPAAWGIANIGPFCVKLESYLRMTGVPYTARIADLGKAPKRKIPFIEEDGKFLGDSQLIIQHLKTKHGDTLDAKLRPKDVAQGHLVRRLLEESLYFHILYERWARDDGWRLYKSIILPLFPPLIGPVAAPMVRRKVIQALDAQGLGRHQPAEVLEMGQEDISAVSTVLGDKPFLLGDHPTSFDASLYAILASIIAFPVDSPFRQFTRAQENLVQYVDRFQQRFFSSWSPPA